MTDPAPASEPPMTDSQIDECEYDRDGMTPIANARPVLRMVVWQKEQIDALQSEVRNLTTGIMADRAEIGRVRGERDALAARLAKAEEAIREILAWYDRDGSVGPFSHLMDAARAALESRGG